MKKILAFLLFGLPAFAIAGIPDSVYVRPIAQSNGEGLFVEWSSNGNEWKNATDGHILSSDYGTWGREKKLYVPSMTKGKEGVIALVFQVNSRSNQFAVSFTRDFIHWRPQDYPYMEGVGQCLEPVITYNAGAYTVVFHNKDDKYFKTTTQDLIHFTQPVETNEKAEGRTLRVSYDVIKALHDNQAAFAAKSAREGELAKDNATRFSGLTDVKAEVTVQPENSKKISDKLMGIFFEDINYSADGGLNAQLVQNGGFEYEPHDRKGDINWNQTTAWELKGNATIITDQPGISQNNCHAVAVQINDGQLGAYYQNSGFDGMAVKKGAKYNLSLYLMGGKVKVSLRDGEKVIASTIVSSGKTWKEVKAVLRPTETCDKAVLAIEPLQTGTTAIDMVSLIPQDTYKGHGLRRDLAETLEALHPKFMRFPGGCVSHGDGLNNIYNWKTTIGPLKDRQPLRNIWGYHQTRQIGYYEFFQMCEDMHMEPLPVLAAGVSCQNSSDGGDGQMGGIPMSDMPAYVQDVLDLIEWANGDASTEWGRKRIEQGHKKPFNLKYIGIGNEDLISPTFEERYLMICKAVKEKYPDITVCGTVGPFYYGSDYDEGWRLATEHHNIIDMVDEHYYVSPGWYIYNQDFYDQYDRTAPKVYLGEWAAHIPGRKSTIETALSEALHYCSLERNGDIVEMSSYAPLLAREGHTQWNPDMIYFNATEVHPTVGYYAQKMCGNSCGDEYVSSTIKTDEKRLGVQERLAVSTVRDSKTGKTYIKLVNILPVTCDSHLNLGNLMTEEKVCKTVTLTGDYSSTTARPTEGTVTLSNDCHIQLPAYSFTLIEL